MASYESLAGCYDSLTGDVDYTAWADYYESFFRESTALDIHTVLDLACGTGSMTAILAQRGYEMISVDKSPEMLMQAMEKCTDLDGIYPLFLNQSMEHLDLYGTIDACVCMLDSVNYVTDSNAVLEAFKRVHCFLMPGGLFIFDIRTPALFEKVDGQIFIDEKDDIYCVWRAEYDQKTRICTYGFDLFEAAKHGLWRRSGEEHFEFAYTQQELCQYLSAAGFSEIRIFGERNRLKPEINAERIVFVAKKDEKWQMKSYES